MDNNIKAQNFTELADTLERYVAEDVKPEHNEMLDLINIYWELHKKLQKDIDRISHEDLRLVVYMSKECEKIDGEIDKQLYCLETFQNYDLPETEHPNLNTKYQKLLELVYCQKQIMNCVKGNIEILNKAGVAHKTNSGCLSIIIPAIIITGLTAFLLL